MALYHVKTNTIADFTGTVTVLNSQGSTVTANGTDLVRPSDWNSGHIQAMTITGNTSGTSSFTGTNIVYAGGSNVTLNVATAASAATISFIAANTTMSGFAPYENAQFVIANQGNGSLMIEPITFPNVTFDRFGIGLSVNNTSSVSGSHTISYYVGIYTRNASTLSLYASTSMTTALTQSGTVGSFSLFSGLRLWTGGWSTSIPGGRYWLGQVSSTASAGSSASYTQMLVSNLASNFTGIFGVAQNTTMQLDPGQGIFTVATNGIPASIAFSQIRGSDSNALRPPYIAFIHSTY